MPSGLDVAEKSLINLQRLFLVIRSKESTALPNRDFDAITNRAVLLQVAPVLRSQDRGTYRRRSGVSENEEGFLFFFLYR